MGEVLQRRQQADVNHTTVDFKRLNHLNFFKSFNYLNSFDFFKQTATSLAQSQMLANLK